MLVELCDWMILILNMGVMTYDEDALPFTSCITA